jgi:hypothetical protein
MQLSLIVVDASALLCEERGIEDRVVSADAAPATDLLCVTAASVSPAQCS